MGDAIGGNMDIDRAGRPEGSSFLKKLGESAVLRWKYLAYVVAMIWQVTILSLKPGFWRRNNRNVLSRQILFTGVEATGFISLIALLVGVSIVVQAQLWLGKVGQSELLGPILVAVVIRELGPLLTNFVVIGRSGAAIATELGNMKVNGEIRILDAQGLDPFPYLIVPRVVGVMISVFCLTVIFVLVCLLSGFVSGFLFGVNPGTPSVFVSSILNAVTPADVINLLAKTMLPGMLTGAICSLEGLRVEGAVTEVPQATTRGLVRSVAALFITSAIVSLLTYLH